MMKIVTCLCLTFKVHNKLAGKNRTASSEESFEWRGFSFQIHRRFSGEKNVFTQRFLCHSLHTVCKNILE